LKVCKVKSQKRKGEIQEGKVKDYNPSPKTGILENLFFIDLAGIY
jgi:hypothetical protein